jgi:SsrA-binding protein
MKIVNRKFGRNYKEIERFEAGIVLYGAEAKTVKNGGLKLEGAYVKIVNNEPILLNAEIPPYRFAKLESYDPRRSRRLLLHKKELVRILTKIRGGRGLTLVPVSCYNKGDILKLEIALVRGRREKEKRRYEKQKTIKRQQQKEAKKYFKK